MFATEIDPAATYCVTSSTMLLCGRQRVRRGAPVLGADLPRALAERGRQHGQARVVEVHACAGVDLGGFAQPGAAVAVLARMGDDSDAALAVAWGPAIPGFAHLLAGAGAGTNHNNTLDADEPGNQVAVYRRFSDGSLELVDHVDTGGQSVLVPWTEEQTPSGIRFRGDEVAPVLLADGSTLVIMTAPEGVWIERIADEARGYRLLGRGFWRDCEIQEAVYLARDAWELA